MACAWLREGATGGLGIREPRARLGVGSRVQGDRPARPPSGPLQPGSRVSQAPGCALRPLLWFLCPCFSPGPSAGWLGSLPLVTASNAALWPQLFPQRPTLSSPLSPALSPALEGFLSAAVSEISVYLPPRLLELPGGAGRPRCSTPCQCARVRSPALAGAQRCCHRWSGSAGPGRGRPGPGLLLVWFPG